MLPTTRCGWRSRGCSWGVPGGDGVLIATSNGLPTIFVYGAGQALADGSPAAGCRVAFSVFQSAPTVFTDEGWTMFDTATTYLAGGCG
jgi:hypothetical protein